MTRFVSIFVTLAVGLCTGIFLSNNTGMLNKTTAVNIVSTVKQVLPASEYVSLVYHYSDVITGENAVYTIEGSIKLGFNGENIEIVHSDNIIVVQIPAIKIVSHEMIPDTFNLYDQTIQKAEQERKVNESRSLFTQARESTEQQFRALLECSQEIKGKYKIVFEWE